MEFNFRSVGIVRSCFKEKFGIPRQPGLVAEAHAVLELLPPYNCAEALRGLEEFSHLWLLFVFHACANNPVRTTVRPPRLGGNQRLGVFATRGTHRPNPMGMSVVELVEIEHHNGQWQLQLKGVDLLDGTPVLDIKPYLPYADCLPEARGGFAERGPEPTLKVEFSPAALVRCLDLENHHPGLRTLIEQTLQYDPRPAYRKNQESARIYGLRLFDLDIH
ncbi:MAG: tRNA (N6-threonylcarbamoyladenosine(37)-N6)-methyltransferase TrmO [Desulfuromonadaceae bacterium]